MIQKLADRAKQKLYAVDDKGNLTGKIVDRWKAHTAPGIKHLAIGILVFDKNNKLVLHKRIHTKVGGDTIDYPVSHPLQDETVEQACWRCLEHEYGIKEKLPLKKLFSFSYNYNYDDGTCENEYLLVFGANYSGMVIPNPKEMSENLILISIKDLVKDVEKNPQKYSVWFWDTAKHLKKLGIK